MHEPEIEIDVTPKARKPRKPKPKVSKPKKLVREQDFVALSEVTLTAPPAASGVMTPATPATPSLIERWKALPTSQKLLIGGGTAAILLFIFRKPVAKGASVVATEVSKGATAVATAVSDAVFRLALPSAAQPYANDMLRVAKEQNVSPFLLAAIMEQESNFGTSLTPKGPTGKGDSGYGHGLMQIDSRSHAEFLAKKDATGKPLWQIPYEALTYAAQLWKRDRAFLARTPEAGATVTVNKDGSKNSQGKTIRDYANTMGVPAGTYKDPRPLTGAALNAAAIAAYNTGAGNVLKALAAGKPVDITTTGHKYPDGTTRKYAESILMRLAKFTTKAEEASRSA